MISLLILIEGQSSVHVMAVHGIVASYDDSWRWVIVMNDVIVVIEGILEMRSNDYNKHMRNEDCGI